ncbi:dihydropteroate synthase [Pseudofulvibacter geojedonensis]|uniref:Dihydropteroate synthase n=1 Tax=Pseudofulvibacter geojedonensis TaxID=1123758 RepID=A0ABW3HZU6_9FLAO
MTINCNGNLINLESPKVMGILNLTPDSFYDGGKYNDEKSILDQTQKMLEDGATFIDIGAYSSRPGAKHISEKEELQRIVPIVKKIISEFPCTIISIDTFRASVAKACINEGASIVNDISSGSMDDNMLATVAELQVPYIMMHMKGTPQNMQLNPTYNNVTQEVLYYFSEQISKARSFGINDVIIDPGFGFGKTIKHNYTLLKELDLFNNLDIPLLVGISRKSMIYKTLNSSAQEALNGTTVLNTIALHKNTNILRVHDVKEAVETVKLIEQLNA